MAQEKSVEIQLKMEQTDVEEDRMAKELDDQEVLVTCPALNSQSQLLAL